MSVHGLLGRADKGGAQAGSSAVWGTAGPAGWGVRRGWGGSQGQGSPSGEKPATSLLALPPALGPTLPSSTPRWPQTAGKAPSEEDRLVQAWVTDRSGGGLGRAALAGGPELGLRLVARPLTASERPLDPQEGRWPPQVQARRCPAPRPPDSWAPPLAMGAAWRPGPPPQGSSRRPPSSGRGRLRCPPGQGCLQPRPREQNAMTRAPSAHTPWPPSKRHLPGAWCPLPTWRGPCGRRWPRL